MTNVDLSDQVEERMWLQKNNKRLNHKTYTIRPNDCCVGSYFEKKKKPLGDLFKYSSQANGTLEEYSLLECYPWHCFKPWGSPPPKLPLTINDISNPPSNIVPFPRRHSSGVGYQVARGPDRNLVCSDRGLSGPFSKSAQCLPTNCPLFEMKG